MRQTVVVGMSGGVDSSVAAWLLKQQGYRVVGVTMRIWQDESCDVLEEQGGCCGLSAVEDARRVAASLKIPYYVMNFKDEFRENVIDYFVSEYLHARTPNPCIACNRYVKWESLLKRSLAIGADFIATGHYARIERLANGRYTLRRAAALNKDQTYALYNLTQEQLSRTKMPVGDYSKDRIRAIAKEIGLPVAEKPDSQEICFIPDHDHASFIARYTGKALEEGNFVDMEGRILGRHKGLAHYTVGQRKGLNLALGYPVYVKELLPATNEVVLSSNADLFTTRVLCRQINWMGIEGLDGSEMEVMVKIRYNHPGTPCRIRSIGEDEVECRFLEPVRAAAPGQAAVFYKEDYVVGGGTIV